MDIAAATGSTDRTAAELQECRVEALAAAVSAVE
jgi:hypothetical protein